MNQMDSMFPKEIKCNKPIRNTILNFNKLVTDLDTKTNSPYFWDYKDFKFCYQPAGHIIPGNLKIVTDSRIRLIISKGPKYRFPAHTGFQTFRELIVGTLNDYCTRCWKREHVKSNALNKWKLKYFFRSLVNVFCFTLITLAFPHLNISSLFDIWHKVFKYPRSSQEVCFGSSW